MTVGNDCKGQAAVLQDKVEQRLKDSLLSELDRCKKEVLKYSGVKEQRITAISIDSFKEFLINIDIDQREAENLLDHDILLILNDFEKRVHKIQKQAVLQILSIVEKCYFDNYYNCTEVLRAVLNNSLKEGAAEVMATLYHNMHEYIENKINYSEKCFWDRSRKLVENIYHQAAELFGLHWEGEIEMPSLDREHIDFNLGSELMFAEAVPSPITDQLPDSILKPLMLKEIKIQVPIYVEKRYQVLYFSCQECLHKSSRELKDKMRNMVDEAKNQIPSQLDSAVKQR